MARYPHKPQALVDDAGGISVAWLRDPSGRLIASSCSQEPAEVPLPDAPLAARLAGSCLNARGQPVTTPVCFFPADESRRPPGW